MDDPPFDPKDHRGTLLTCGHDGGGPADGCKTCERFAADAKFREVTLKHQENIRQHRTAAAASPAPPPTRVELCRYISDEPTDRLDCQCAHKWRHACDVYGTCCRNDADNADGIQSCSACPQYRGRGTEEPDAEFVRVVLKCDHAPGDAAAMTAAVEALQAASTPMHANASAHPARRSKCFSALMAWLPGPW